MSGVSCGSKLTVMTSNSLPTFELHHLERACEPAQDFAAEHWALVVNQVQDHGLLAEVVSQLHGFPVSSRKAKICRESAASRCCSMPTISSRRQLWPAAP